MSAELATERIATDRGRIDELDERILELIEERIAVSHGIQSARLSSGGRRTDTRREQEIIARYSRRFGQSGARLGLILLEISRGTGAENPKP